MFYLFINGGSLFSQELDQVGLVIKTVYGHGAFYGLGLDLGNLKNRKIEVYSDSAFSKKHKKPGEDCNLVIEDSLTGFGQIVSCFYGPKPGQISSKGPNDSWDLLFATVNKQIKFQEWSDIQGVSDLFKKIMASEHRTYTLNSTVASYVKINPLDDQRDNTKDEILEWLIKNNEIYNFDGAIKNKMKIYEHLDKKGNACFLLVNQPSHLINGMGTGGMFFYVGNPEDKTNRKVLRKEKLNINNVTKNTFDIFTGNDNGIDEIILDEKNLRVLIKDTFNDKFSYYFIEKTFSVNAIV